MFRPFFPQAAGAGKTGSAGDAEGDCKYFYCVIYLSAMDAMLMQKKSEKPNHG